MQVLTHVCVPSTLPTELSLPTLMANLLYFLIFKFLKINRITKTNQNPKDICKVEKVFWVMACDQVNHT